MKYTYVDGAGNRYSLNDNQLEYNPMTPEMSSSGIYSGGQPFITKLEKIDLIKLIDVLERALWSKNDHTDKRTMGSGTLIKIIGNQRQSVYLSYKSNSINEIDKIFEEIKTNL